MPASALSWKAPAGSVLLAGAPAFSFRERVEAGMSATIQCQKPLPVGASGSYSDTTKLYVFFGKPDHDSCGEMSLPPLTPNTPENWASFNAFPFVTVELVTLNDGTFGRQR